MKKETKNGMKRTPGNEPACAGHAAQNAFALACFRAIGSASELKRPWDAVRDWKQALRTLEIHGLLPFLGHAASGAFPLPDNVRQLVLVNKLRTATYQSNALDALTGISGEMKSAGVPYAVLKGPYLYELLYRDLFPRAYGDIDLLVPARRVTEATAALERAGYDSGSKPGKHASMPRWHFHVILTSNKPGGLPVELHRTLVDKANLYRICNEELFGRITEFNTGRGGFTVLSLEDQFIYLCLHVAKHGVLNAVGLRGGYAAEWYCSPAAGNRLLCFLDIDLFLMQQMDHLDWAAVAERAQRWNVSDDLINCLRVLRLLQPESPAAVAMQRLGHPAHATGAAPVRRHGALDCVLRSVTGRALLERSMRTCSRFSFRPVRCLLIGSCLAPSPSRLLRYYGKTNYAWIPWLYLIHPFHMFRKILIP